jgi:hypothetical protein
MSAALIQAMPGLVEKTGADAQANRGQKNTPILTLSISPAFFICRTCCPRQATRNRAWGLGVNNPFHTTDAFAIFNILTLSGLNTSGHERKNKLSYYPMANIPSFLKVT